MSTTTKLTLNEFLALPETEPASEFACGEVYQKPMPTRAHGRIAGTMTWAIIEWMRANNRDGLAGPEIRCVFGPGDEARAYIPDVVYIAGERLPADDTGDDAPFFGAPDLAVEVLSPGDRPTRVLDKVLFYLDNGVRLVLVLDPGDQTVRAYRPGGPSRLLAIGDSLDGVDVLPGFRIPVAELFAVRRRSTG